jgi:hypothetical protein
MTQDPKPQFLIDLERDGYVVVPGVVGKEECAEFQEASLKWLESFPYGFKRDDRSTRTRENLPEGATWVPSCPSSSGLADFSVVASTTVMPLATRTLCGELGREF